MRGTVAKRLRKKAAELSASGQLISSRKLKKEYRQNKQSKYIKPPKDTRKTKTKKGKNQR